ncbi:MAG: penicillin-binding protein 2 [Sulfurospirillum sp.]|nr:MAG: penicillin-binding protein 2 [Sulfurospirillum sp.]
MNQNENKKVKIAIIFSILTILFLILIGALLKILSNRSDLPKIQAVERDRAIRGDILSKNRYTIATSKKLYTAQVDTRCIDPDKFDLFVTLFSIFSKLDPFEIKEQLQSNFGYVDISMRLDSKSARYLKQLRYTLNRYQVFRKYIDEHTGRTYYNGLSIRETGEFRTYPRGDTFSPYIGFVRRGLDHNYRTIWGKYGLESYYNEQLEGIQSTLIQGRRDVRGNIILDNNSEVKTRIDGYDVITSIDLRIQKSLEQILDKYKEQLGAKEIIAAVMDSKTANIIAVASSRRYNPGKILEEDVPKTSISAVRYIFEPGSVMKPITFSLLLQEGLIKPNDIVNVENGKYRLGNRVITDEHKYDYLSTENIIVHSSNIGMAKLSTLLDTITFFKGLRKFGFSRPSGIDLSYELSGSIPNIHQLKNSVFKATASYGYGIRVNFFQLLKAYNAFNDNGITLRPTIGEFYNPHTRPIRKIYRKRATRVLDEDVAHTMKRILIKTVKEGTGKGTYIPGLQIGGKTGTAQIAVRGVYANIYNSSFFGFANDSVHHYTIGVTVIEPDPEKKHYFASQSAVPVFRQIVEAMVDAHMLTPAQ